MAKFPAITLTKAGQNMLVKAGTGRTDDRLIFTKLVLGAGELGSANIRDLTAVIAPKITVTVSEYQTDPRKPGQAVLVFKYDNKNVEQGFRHKEVGLYAKNGDVGSETLFAYSNAGANDGYIDDKSSPMPLQTLRVGVAIGDSQNVTAKIDMSNAVSIEQLQRHESDPNAHQAIVNRLEEEIRVATAAAKIADNSIQPAKLADLVSSGTHAFITYNSKGQVTSGSDSTSTVITFNSGANIYSTLSVDTIRPHSSYITLSGNVNAQNYRVMNLASPSSAQDAATKQYVDDAIKTVGVKLRYYES